jgi:hypothetical protein
MHQQQRAQPRGQRAPRRWSSLLVVSLVVGVIWPIVYLIGIGILVQTMRGNAAHAAKEVQTSQPADNGERIEPKDVKNLSQPQQEPARLDGKEKEIREKSQAAETRPPRKCLCSSVSAVITQFIKSLRKHASPKTDDAGFMAEPCNAPKGRPSADASTDATKN